MFFLDKNIANSAELKQKVQLRKMMLTMADSAQVNKVQFSSNTQNSIEKLTGVLDKLNLSSYSYSQQTRARSPSPYNTRKNNRVQHQQQQLLQSLPFCTKCLCNRHVAHQCRITFSQSCIIIFKFYVLSLKKKSVENFLEKIAAFVFF